jgi:bifunctional non-homologous end joining protein LigD
VGAATTVEVGGRTLGLSNLSKVLFPEHGFTKGELIDYYAKVSGAILPHLAGRPVSVKRYPDGVDGQGFFGKNAPAGTPEWVRTVELPAPGSTMNRDKVQYVVVDDLPTLIWLANLAAIELHVPQWRVGPRGRVYDPDLLVFDLDPGAPASIVECCHVAQLLRDELAADGLTAYPKTSGSKGMQLYAPIKDAPDDATSAYAKELAQRLEKVEPDLIVSRMRRALRPGKVLIDWSQNNAAKTTVAPYSVRARPEPTVSTPVTWDEVEACQSPADLRFLTDDVIARVGEHGDLFAPLLERKGRPKLPSV